MTDATQVGSEDVTFERATNLLAETGPEFEGLIALPLENQSAYLEVDPSLQQRTAKGEEDLPQVFRSMWGMVVEVAQDNSRLYDDLDYQRVARVGAMVAAESLTTFFEDNEYDRPGKSFVLTPKITGHIRRYLDMKLSARATVRELAEFLPDPISSAVEASISEEEVMVDEVQEVEPIEVAPEAQTAQTEMIDTKRAEYLIRIFGVEHSQTIEGLSQSQAVALADKVGDLYRGIPGRGVMAAKGQFIRASQVVHYITGKTMAETAKMYGQVYGSASTGLYRTLPSSILDHYSSEDLARVLAGVVAEQEDRTEQILAKYAKDKMPDAPGKPRPQPEEITEQQPLFVDEAPAPPKPPSVEPEWYKSPLHPEAAADATDQDIKDVLERVMPKLRFARDTEKRALRKLFHPTTETWREPRDLNGVKTDLVRMVERNTDDESLPLDCKLSRAETDLLIEIVKSPTDPDKQRTLVRALRAHAARDQNGSRDSSSARQVFVSALLKLGEARELQLK